MRSLCRTLLLSAVAMACLGNLGETASSYVIPKRAVFEGTTTNEWEDWGFWTSRLNGSEPERIVPDVDPGGARPHDPVLSPDGLQIAFTRYEYKTKQTCLEVTSVEGGRAVPVFCSSSASFGEVTWSPDGNELAFSGYTKTTLGVGILAFNLQSEELRVVADWQGYQRSPSFSPDGTKIAFETDFVPSEEEAYEPGIWIVDSNGTGSRQLTAGWEREPDWSPDGTQLVAWAYYEPLEEESEQEDEGAFVLLNSTTGATDKWLLNKDYDAEYAPRWSPDGDRIHFSRWIEEGPFENEEEQFVEESISPNGTERESLLPGFFWVDGFNPQEATSVEPDPAELLKRYEPRLHYDLQEQYFADSAAEATDGPENRILASDRETIVAAHEYPYALPSLATLEESAADFGVIDEGPEHAEDAATMHAQPQYADKAYARVFHDGTSGTDWLDYWFYYYYDDQEFAGIGVHEGDWEHVAYRLDNRAIPDLAVYSRHGSETATCAATAIGWEVTDGTTVSPKVYVANASHADYFAAGEYNRPFPKPTDQANGDGAIATPSVVEVDSAPYTSTTAEPQWFYWNGTWGASTAEKFHSPDGPPDEGSEWEDLQAWAEEHEECEIAEGGKSALRAAPNASERTLPRPLAPSLNAHHAGNGILVHYNLADRGADASYILLTVTAQNELDATRSRRFRLKSDLGSARLPLPLAHGPYLATASTFSASGERSDVQAADVLP